MDHGHATLNKCKGPNKSMHLQLLTRSVFNKNNPTYNFNSPVWHLIHREDTDRVTYSDRVIELLKKDITHELFGLTYTELMEMDFPTFDRIRKAVEEVLAERNKERAALARDKL